MSEALSTNPNGIFDRSKLGEKTKPVEFEVEAGRLAFFSETVGERNPIHFDNAAAKEAGHPGVVAPATFAIVVDLEAGRTLSRQGEPGALELVNCDFRRLLHGEERYDYDGLIYAGDTLTVETEVTGFEDKKGGALEFAYLRTTIDHPDRGTLIAPRPSAGVGGRHARSCHRDGERHAAGRRLRPAQPHETRALCWRAG